MAFGLAMSERKSGFRWESIAERFNVFAVHTALYRLLGGRLVGRNILILTTVGNKSGRLRSTPLYFVRDGGDYVIVASNGGEDRYPSWWHNIRSDSNVTIQVGREVIRCRAEVAATEDGPRLWSRLDAVYGGYRRYREATTRELTIFRLRAHLGSAAQLSADPFGGVQEGSREPSTD